LHRETAEFKTKSRGDDRDEAGDEKDQREMLRLNQELFGS
jgi:hypothetical protein